jgi:hypothetical protein
MASGDDGLILPERLLQGAQNSRAPRHTRNANLFDGHGFSEVTRLIDIAPAADCDIVGEQLQRDNFDEWGKQLKSRRDIDHVLNEARDGGVSLRGKPR